MIHCSGDGSAKAKDKIRYPSPAAAQAALLDTRIKAALRDNKRRKENKYYWCRVCFGWHLTSQIRRGE